MLKFFQPVIGTDESKAINKTVKAGWISSQGKIIEEFEKNFSKYHGMKYAVSTSNCTTALHLSLLSLGIGKGDEVICSNLTFIAPANMIELTGAKLVLVDASSVKFTDVLVPLQLPTSVVQVIFPLTCSYVFFKLIISNKILLIF